VRDSIPKAIGFFLVKASQERLQFELYAQINKNEALTKQLGEPERVTEERKALNNTLEILKNAVKILTRDPDITNTAAFEDELGEELRQEAMNVKRQAQQDGNNNGSRGGDNRNNRGGDPGFGGPGSSSSGNLNSSQGGNPNQGNPQNNPNYRPPNNGGPGSNNNMRPPGPGPNNNGPNPNMGGG